MQNQGFDLFKNFFDVILHIDKYLAMVFQNYGLWTFVIIFVVIFCETGLVVTPFLPGDSLLFAAGALSATTGALDVNVLALIIFIAAVLGDNLNYWIGNFIGPRVFSINSKLLKKEYLEKTHAFYEKHGGKTNIIARFVPIIRTFAPFVAGVGKMTYSKFLTYDIIGGVLWTVLFVYAGYYFGTMSFVKNNFSLVVIAIILISVMPGVIEFIRVKYFNRHETDNLD